MSSSFGADSFLMRWLFAVVLVFGSYNPTPYSYFGWLLSDEFSFGPLPALAMLLRNCSIVVAPMMLLVV
ncbi:MAG: DUF6524 family protein, partial [Pseudomonadota bacterium]